MRKKIKKGLQKRKKIGDESQRSITNSEVRLSGLPVGLIGSKTVKKLIWKISFVVRDY